MLEKECFKCLIIKPISEFYKQAAMSDGHLNKCKECTKNDVKKHRIDNIEKVREYDRNRPNKHERVLENKQRLQNDPIAYKAMIDKKNEWCKRNKHKRNAQNKLARAVLKGVVIRKFECEKCTGTIKVEAHHEDYEKPLDVIWLCSKCHHERHVELRKIERQKDTQ